MAAPGGNQYWRRRSKHGRDKIIQDPEFLAQASDEYFTWCIENPIITKDYRGKDATQVEIEHPRVFQKGELARFCGVSSWRQIDELRKKSDDFQQIITHIEGVIHDQKFSNAAVNLFNSTIMSRDLGLTDKQDHTIRKERPLFDNREDEPTAD